MKVTVRIDGYGVVRVRVPRRPRRGDLADGIADAVAQTVRLIAPPTPTASRFHPALGRVDDA